VPQPRLLACCTVACGHFEAIGSLQRFLFGTTSFTAILHHHFTSLDFPAYASTTSLPPWLQGWIPGLWLAATRAILARTCGIAMPQPKYKSRPRYQFQRFAPICDVVHRPPPAGWDCGATVRLSPAPASLHPRCVHDCGDDLGRDRVREDGL